MGKKATPIIQYAGWLRSAASAFRSAPKERKPDAAVGYLQVLLAVLYELSDQCKMNLFSALHRFSTANTTQALGRAMDALPNTIVQVRTALSRHPVLSKDRGYMECRRELSNARPKGDSVGRSTKGCRQWP